MGLTYYPSLLLQVREMSNAILSPFRLKRDVTSTYILNRLTLIEQDRLKEYFNKIFNVKL